MRKAFYCFVWLFLILVFSSSYAGEKIIVIDVGHGGKDTGVEIDGILEKDLTFEIAKKIKTLNTDSEYRIILTRDSDEFISLEDRVSHINSLNPDFVLSLHINSSDDTRENGFDILIGNEDSTKKEGDLALMIESYLSEQLAGNGIKKGNSYILKNSKSPTVIIELGYLSNLGNRQLLISEEGQHRVAEAIYNALK